MTVIDKILSEWSYRCSDGIVDMNNPTKVAILNAILEENGVDLEQDKITEPKAEPADTTFTDSPEEFTKFVLNKYAVEKQIITGLDSLYNAIQKSPEKDKLFNIIKTSGNRSLTAGKSSIQSIEGTLFNLIMSFIKIKNGEPSELWFAIMYSGKAKGGVAKGDDAEADVKIDNNTGVSIKNYSQISSLDFGALPSDELKRFKTITNLLIILTDVKFTAGLGRDSLQGLLDFIKTPKFQSDLKELLKIGKDTNIKALKNIYNVISPYLPDGDTEKLVDEFIDGEEGINKLIAKKIEKVQWWAVIYKNDLYLEPSDIVVSKLRSKEGQLTPIFGQIKGNNLFVNGNRLLGIESKKSKKITEDDDTI
jgi:hypothetical protein